MMSARFMLLVALTHCASAPAQPVSMTLPPATTGKPAVEMRCDGKPFVLHRDDVVHECWPDTCERDIPFTVDNCTDQEAEVVGMEYDTSGFGIEGLPKIPPRGTQRYEYPLADRLSLTLRGLPGKHWLIVRVKRSDASEVTLRRQFEIIDAKMNRAIAECAATGGDWGQHGANLGCEPIMADANKKCSDERECSGECVFDRAVIVGNEEHVHGHCSRLRLEYGCRSIIGKTNHGRVPLPSIRTRTCL